VNLSGFGASCSQHPVPSTAVGEAVGDVLEQVGPEPDLVVVFVSANLTGTLDEILDVIRRVLQPRTLIGATASTVISNGLEIEGGQGVTVWAGRVGDVVPFVLEIETADDGEITPRSDTAIDKVARGSSAMLLLADPFSFPADPWLQSIRNRWSPLKVFGGYASAGNACGGNRLVLDDRVVASGAVGVFFRGPVHVETIVSQGCRPIGSAFTVTRSERNVVYELGGRPAVERLDELVAGLSNAERAPLRAGVHLGLVIDEHQLDFERGDFRVRKVHGADRSTGAIAVDHEVPLGATVQFHSRDADSAAEDLEIRLGDLVSEALVKGTPPLGALLFRCTGRGARFFRRPSHDATLVNDLCGAPVAGMACLGEFGTSGTSHGVHTCTASIAVFR
jgi:small ligand-binding sensory domain FIST